MSPAAANSNGGGGGIVATGCSSRNDDDIVDIVSEERLTTAVERPTGKADRQTDMDRQTDQRIILCVQMSCVLSFKLSLILYSV